MEGHCLNPAVGADLEFIKDEVLGGIRRCRKRNDKSPQTLTPQLIVSSRDPQGSPLSRTGRWKARHVMLDSVAPQGMEGKRKGFTTATSSRTDGIGTGGRNTVYSIRLS